jgi:DHA1 family tetracycline resistance protein-like MFS transporter
MMEFRPGGRAASVPFIFATVFLESLGIGIIIPILPDLIRRFTTDPDFVSKYLGYFMSVYALMQFVFSPVLGRLADRFGRRPVLLSSIFGSAIDYVIMAFAPNLIILFIGRVISGMTGAAFTVATAYMADISDDSNRSSNFGLIGAAFGMGFIIGPAIGGAISHFGPAAPFLAAALLNLLNFLFGYFVLPESLKPENRRTIEWKQVNPFLSLAKLFSSKSLQLFVWVFILLYLSSNVHPSVWTLYTEAKFGWTAVQVGISLACVGIAMAFVQGYLMRILIPRWGDPKAVLVGTVVGAISFVAMAFATEGWMIYVILIPSALQGISNPALQSMISRQVPADEQGELQGSLMSLASLTAVIAPLMYTYLFAEFNRPTSEIQFIGMPYLIAGVICASSLILLAVARRHAKAGQPTASGAAPGSTTT